MAKVLPPKNKVAITPLWIISAFVTLTEVTLGYALTKTTGGVQITLTAFVIAFAILIAAAFFLVLWHKPFVFYAPSDYGNINPIDFIGALTKQAAPVVQEQIRLAREVEENPADDNANFRLIEGLLDPTVKQHLILMARTCPKTIPCFESGGKSCSSTEGRPRGGSVGCF